MVDWLKRFLFALAGGAVAAGLVGIVEAHTASLGETGAHAPAYGQLVLGDVGVLAPLALLVSLAVGGVTVFLEPARAIAPGEHLAHLREEPVLTRSWTAALLPLGILTAFAWCVTSAHLAKGALAEGPPSIIGMSLAASSLGALLALAVLALALLAPLRRALARASSRSPRFIDPVITAGVAASVVAVAFAFGVYIGDTGGDGASVLAIFGVLKRPELDLRPIINLGAIAAAAYLAPIALAHRASVLRVALAALVIVFSLAITVREARALNDAPAVARTLQRSAPLGKVGLAVVRRLSDRDKDGTSALFGGGDCNDRDPRQSPNGVEVPGNGVDEDCSGADLVLSDTEPSPLPAALPKGPALDPEMNLVFITVDTLRTDLGFMGYSKPVSPNMDGLAQRSVVFDRAYSMASYTGKSIGPLLIGKYPSETQRDGGHFNAYYPSNVFVTERFKAAGIHTMGAASHWYFVPWSGLTQGMDEWDLSARPASGQGDNDTSVTSKELADAAIGLLSRPSSTAGRFFLWVHFFDPHEQYMPHEGAPDFLPEGKPTPAEKAKAAYDGEVWFTDKHIGRILDFIGSQPWGKRTAIVLTSDHGEAFFEHNMNWHGMEIWEPLVHVPLVMYVPGLVPHHVPVKRSHVDVVPTLLDIMSLPAPKPGELSGQSVLDDLVAPAGTAFAERDVYIDMPQGPYTGMRRAILTGDTPGMKLIHFGGNQYQLFDLAADPGEKEDLVLDRARLLPVLERFNAKRAHVKEIAVPPTPAP